MQRCIAFVKRTAYFFANRSDPRSMFQIEEGLALMGRSELRNRSFRPCKSVILRVHKVYCVLFSGSDPTKHAQNASRLLNCSYGTLLVERLRVANLKVTVGNLGAPPVDLGGPSVKLALPQDAPGL